MEAQSTLAKPSEPTDALPIEPGLTSRSVARIRRILHGDLLPFIAMLTAAAFAFRYPLFQSYRFVGNSDRWTQYLLFAQFHSDALASGSFRAWSQNLLGGFDSLAQPFAFFSPLFLIAPLLHTADVVAVFGYVDLGMLVATLLVTYWVIQRFTRDRVASLAGALIYTCTTYSLLKLSQGDSTYVTILVAPILFYVVHTASRARRLRTIALIAAIAAFCLYSAFLQDFSYIVLFLLLYSGWRALGGDHEGLFALLTGLFTATVIAMPRLLVEYQTLSDSLRASSPLVPDFSATTLLRFFSRDIYGRSYLEGLAGPQLNLYEGDLLFATVFASLLLVAIVLDRGRRASTPWTSLRRGDIWFFVAYILLVFGTMHVEVVYRFVSLLYANLSFQHSRIAVSVLLPIALLSALYLRRRDRDPIRMSAWATLAVFLGIVAIATTFDYEAWRDPILGMLGLPAQPFLDCQACSGWLAGVHQFLAVDAIRFSVLALLFVAIVVSPRLLPWLSHDAVRVALALGIGFQAVWSANIWLSGPDTRDQAIPFPGNNLVMASPDNFGHPTAEEVHQLSSLLDNDAYRSITICPPQLASVDCANSIGLGWNLRLLDGYLSVVPLRLASLPWAPNNPGRGVATAASLHHIRFESESSVPWRLMSLLNVRDAVVVSPALYSNAGSRLPADLQIVHNPSTYIYPRAYFAQTVQSVSEAEDIALIRSFFGACKECDNGLTARKPVDEVEGPVKGAFDDSGDVRVSGSGDRLDVTFLPSSQQRFLVLNELYASGWSARAAGQELAIYPTNVVLRGVVVPAGAAEVTFEYHSFLSFALWYTIGVGIVAVLGGVGYRYGDRFFGSR
jgi:hypothetical protein